MLTTLLALSALALPPQEALDNLYRECDQRKAESIARLEAGIERIKNIDKEKPDKSKKAAPRQNKQTKEAKAKAKKFNEAQIEQLQTGLTAIKSGKKLAIPELDDDEKLKVGRIVRHSPSSFGLTTGCLQVLDSKRFIGRFQTKPTLFSGVDTTNFTDDESVPLPTDLWYVKGTYSYEAANGAQRTIWEVEAIDEAELMKARK